MNDDFFIAMRRAASSTRALNLAEATRVIQDALVGRPTSRPRATSKPEINPTPPSHRSKPFSIDPNAEIVEPGATPNIQSSEPLGSAATSQRMRKPLGETLRILREGRTRAGIFGSVPGTRLSGLEKHSPSPAAEGKSQFLTRSYTCAAGTRSYKLYIPAAERDPPQGLIIMLHGCKQDPDDFATGTGMNAVAEANGLLVAYPRQTGTANPSSCWNWFRPTDQKRGEGEPSIIAGITAEIMSRFGLNGSRVFVAGMSAGGAMAAVMAETYPDLYGAVGIHSGLAYGSASDVMSALCAMRGDSGAMSKPRASSAFGVRTIVFQGSDDRTVHPSNAERIAASATLQGTGYTTQTQTDRSEGGRAYTRTIVMNPEGLSTLEYWLVDGTGHAWSGGNAGGSYTDQHGPDATSEMVRFFLGNSRQGFAEKYRP
ncbi:PHB depolymerase family esterase [Rhizobium lusitanum]|uniref:PHB depolymerase family esterase n=1 Tax=Rhizobium lusitanum TaxID=293958 RepID=A0A6L9UBB3_9HYPH|nr:PHB depolymerase family esterase [Rhizobium lusitanum]NEI72914.1 PHB depolymerase family esterase [Rhizobium lusitanum]